MRMLLRPQGLRYGTTLLTCLPPACFRLSVMVVTQCAGSTVVTLHEVGSLTLHILHRSDVLLWTDPIPSTHIP